MRKITSYILNGQGLGMKFLAGLSVLMALIFAIVIRVQGAAYVPYAQEIADQMLPVKVVNGQIVEPLNTFKMAQIRIEGRDTPLALPLVLDTRVTNLDANLLPGAGCSPVDGMHLTPEAHRVVAEALKNALTGVTLL